MPLERPAVLALAPRHLENHRQLRYRGDDQALPNDSFVARDQASFAELYLFLSRLEGAAVDEEQLDAFIRTNDIDALASRLAQIGRHQQYEGAVAAAAHDLRGGLFSALLLEIGAPVRERLAPAAIAALTRDCSKQMRNLLAEIDPPRRRRDVEARFHALSELVGALLNYGGSEKSGRASLTVEADVSATIAASCAEFGTIERVTFNLLENAATHTSTRAIKATLVALERDLRVVVSNTLSSAYRERIESMLARDPSVFYSSFSSTGSGIGLQVVAELVGRAYGIERTSDLVSGGHIGTAVVDGAFASWFHWPLAERDASAAGSCDCADDG